MESEEVDWTLCLICQTNTTEPLRSATDNGLKTLSTNLNNFKDIKALPQSMLNFFPEEGNLYETLTANNTRYHHSCRNSYSDYNYNRAKRKYKKQSDASTEKPSTSHHDLRSDRVSLSLGDLYCCFCTKPDIEEHLIAAGTYQASKKKVNTLHLKQLGEKWLNWALCLENYTHVVTTLSVGDLTSNQLYYHKRCYTEFYNAYSKHVEKQKAQSAEEIDNHWFKSISLGKIVSYLYEKEDESPGTIYVVKELEDMYITLLKFHHVNVISHITQFADSLVEAIPGLHKRTVNNKVTVYFEGTIDMLLKDHFNVTSQPDAFARAIKDIVVPIRNSMKNTHNKFDGTFKAGCQKDSVPIELLTLISMLIDGAGIENKGFSQEALTISQLAMYNFRNKQMSINRRRRHLKSLETPLPTFISLKIYATVRSRALIDSLFSLGVCLSYNRVLEITKDIGLKELQKYEINGCFIPDNVKLHTHTTIAKDNIDLNSQSTIIKSHFHGISMSVLQFPTLLNPGISQQHNLAEESDIHTTTSKKIPSIPSDYIEFKDLPYYDKSPLFAPPCKFHVPYEEVKEFNTAKLEEVKWLDLMSNVTVAEESSSWAKYHSDIKRKEVETTGITSILPLIDKPVHTLKAQYHCMSVIVDTIKKINPDQIPIDTCDQPVFALTKEVQWRYPETFSDDLYLSILGGLHIEQEVLTIHGDFINGSGLAEILENNNLSTIGSSSAALDVNDIKRSRYCLQVSLCALYKKLKEAHVNSDSPLSLLEWLDECTQTREMAFYFKMIVELELTILIFVRSLREGNYHLLIESLWQLLKWFFALDKYNYARWCTVHWFDLAKLSQVCPSAYSEMMKGHFSFQKSRRQFSRMALDQIHQQNNKVIKGVSGATNLLNRADDSGLSRWELCVPDLARLITEFQDQVDRNNTNLNIRHHEDNLQFQKTFFEDVNKTIAGMHCNPFEMETLTAINNPSISFAQNVFSDISKVELRGKEQLLDFVKHRLLEPSV